MPDDQNETLAGAGAAQLKVNPDGNSRPSLRHVGSQIFFSTITYAPVVFILTTVAWFVAPKAFATRWLPRDALWLGGSSAAVLCALYAAVWWIWLVVVTRKYRETPELVQIAERRRMLSKRLDALAGQAADPKTHRDLCEARACVNAVRRRLRAKSAMPRPQLVLTLWRLLHLAEEALIPLEALPVVLEGALYDELRLEGSTIDSTNQLLLRLRRAVLALSPEAAAYLDQQPPARLVAATNQPSAAAMPAPSPLPGSGADPNALPAHPACEEVSPCTQARLILRQVRRAINEFRDSRHSGLIVAAHNLRLVTGWSAFFTYLLLGFCIAAGARANVLITVMVLYLVGAVVGLFKRLSAEISADAASEDHGLFGARLVVTPLLSGLAAVGGVVLTIMIYSVATGAPAIPNLATAPQAPATTAVVSSDASRSRPELATTGATDGGEMRLPSLDLVFDMDKFPFALILAAAFGLTPNLLISGLQTQTAKLRSDLRSSEAPEKSRS